MFCPIRLILGRNSTSRENTYEVSVGTKILRNTYSTVRLVLQRVLVAVVWTVFFSEESDTNALNLVYDSDGDNPESLRESRPRP